MQSTDSSVLIELPLSRFSLSDVNLLVRLSVFLDSKMTYCHGLRGPTIGLQCCYITSSQRPMQPTCAYGMRIPARHVNHANVAPCNVFGADFVDF